jgi:hypothetical protein
MKRIAFAACDFIYAATYSLARKSKSDVSRQSALKQLSIIGASATLLAALSVPAFAQAQTDRYQALANAAMAENRPTADTAALLKDELLFQRATQTYLWALPLINTLGMKVASEKAFGAGYNILPVWKKRIDTKTLATTPNSDLIYAMSYLDLGKDGPMVLEAPPGLQGVLLDFWQRPIPGPNRNGTAFFGDIGSFGPDNGDGGKFLIVPPGYGNSAPLGYYVYRSQTNNVFVLLRSFYRKTDNLGPALKLIEKTKIYPLGERAGIKPMRFPDASSMPINMLPSSNGSAFDQLKLFVDSEADDFADPDWRGMLASLGIVKGQSFYLSAPRRAILDLAAKTAYKMSRVVGFEESVGGRSYLVYPDRHWVNPVADGTPSNPGGALNFAWQRSAGGYLDVDARIWFFTDNNAISPWMLGQALGKGVKYMIDFADSTGTPLSGESSYRLNLPPNVPAANFWSLTLYEAENASGLANGQPFPSLGSRDKLTQNADGSIDLYFGPSAPAGQTSNWLRTVPGKGYFAMLRLYSPTEPAIDKTWKPGDFEKINDESGKADAMR